MLFCGIEQSIFRIFFVQSQQFCFLRHNVYIMHKHLLSVAGALAIATATLAQPTIPNGNFETWTVDAWSQDKAAPWSWYEINTTPPAFSKSTDAHSGSFALKVQNKAKSGRQASIDVPKTGTKVATRLKGFIKTNIGAGEKAIVEISAGNTETSGTQTTYYYKTIGWQTFTGVSNGYVAIDIPLDFSLDQDVFYGKEDFQYYHISVSAYDKFNFTTGSGASISENTYVIVDDFTLEGNVDLTYFTNAFPESFEKWSEMDGSKYPYGWSFLANPYKDEYKQVVSQSTDAKDGSYALKYSLTAPDTDFSLWQKFTKTNNQSLKLGLKYSLAEGDTIFVAFLATDFSEMSIKLTLTKETLSSYKDFVIDLSDLKTTKDYAFILTLQKGSLPTVPTYVLMDNYELVDPSSIEDEYFNANLVQASPNPSSTGLFKISNVNNAPLEVSDLLGNRVAASISREGSNATVDLSAQSRGMYLVNVGGKKTMKIQY